MSQIAPALHSSKIWHAGTMKITETMWAMREILFTKAETLRDNTITLARKNSQEALRSWQKP
jgi:hypothetical protein